MENKVIIRNREDPYYTCLPDQLRSAIQNGEMVEVGKDELQPNFLRIFGSELSRDVGLRLLLQRLQ